MLSAAKHLCAPKARPFASLRVTHIPDGACEISLSRARCMFEMRGIASMSNQTTRRMTMAQAVIAFLKNQYVERDGVEQAFFAGCFGIFGHGNIAGIGQALQQMPEFRCCQAIFSPAATWRPCCNSLSQNTPRIFRSMIASSR